MIYFGMTLFFGKKTHLNSLKFIHPYPKVSLEQKETMIDGLAEICSLHDFYEIFKKKLKKEPGENKKLTTFTSTKSVVK